MAMITCLSFKNFKSCSQSRDTKERSLIYQRRFHCSTLPSCYAISPLPAFLTFPIEVFSPWLMLHEHLNQWAESAFRCQFRIVDSIQHSFWGRESVTVFRLLPLPIQHLTLSACTCRIAISSRLSVFMFSSWVPAHIPDPSPKSGTSTVLISEETNKAFSVKCACLVSILHSKKDKGVEEQFCSFILIMACLLPLWTLNSSFK